MDRAVENCSHHNPPEGFRVSGCLGFRVEGCLVFRARMPEFKPLQKRYLPATMGVSAHADGGGRALHGTPLQVTSVRHAAKP